MQRRKFIELLVGMAATWPLAVRSQQRLPTIGFLGSASPEVARRWVAAFVSRLRELGWIEGRTVAIEYRWADAHPEKLKSGLPSKATPEEAKAVIANSIAYFGKYSLDEASMVLSLDIHASTLRKSDRKPFRETQRHFTNRQRIEI